jgi:predicted nucleotidyltransferase
MNRMEVAENFAKSIDLPEIKKMILFGSVARGDDNDESDIDIFILTTDEDKISDELYDKVVEFIGKFQELISLIIVSTSDFNVVKNTSFYHNVIKEGIILG